MTQSPTPSWQTLQPDVAQLRRRLQQLNVWPAAGDEFLTLIPLAQWQGPALTARDEEWLPQVVRDVRKGCDLGSRYPDFFQKLLTNATLRQAFLNRLDKEST